MVPLTEPQWLWWPCYSCSAETSPQKPWRYHPIFFHKAWCPDWASKDWTYFWWITKSESVLQDLEEDAGPLHTTPHRLTLWILGWRGGVSCIHSSLQTEGADWEWELLQWVIKRPCWLQDPLLPTGDWTQSTVWARQVFFRWNFLLSPERKEYWVFR